MPTLAQVRSRVDTYLSGTAWPYITARELAYYRTHGRFCQVRRTHTVEPPHTTAAYQDTAPDAMGDAPHDQTASCRPSRGR
jgi:hypothetical protein